jgi:hypothetical protein
MCSMRAPSGRSKHTSPSSWCALPLISGNLRALFMYACACMQITYTYIYIYIYIYICTHSCIYIYIHTHIYMLMYTHIYTHIYTYLSAEKTASASLHNSAALSRFCLRSPCLRIARHTALHRTQPPHAAGEAAESVALRAFSTHTNASSTSS